MADKDRKRPIVIRGKLESVSAVRQQYKPYGYQLLPTDVYVQLEVQPDEVVETFETETGIAIVLNLDGFTTVLSSLAGAIDEMHEAYVRKARAAGRTPQF